MGEPSQPMSLIPSGELLRGKLSPLPSVQMEGEGEEGESCHPKNWYNHHLLCVVC